MILPWYKSWAVWGSSLLAVGLYSCTNNLTTSIDSNVRATVRVLIPRQTAGDPSIESVQVFLFSDASLQNSVGSTGLLSLRTSAPLSGSIDDVASGIYFLQCRSFDQSGSLITNLNSQVVPVDVARVGTQVEVRCNTSSLQLPTINVEGVPEFLVSGNEVPIVITAATVPGTSLDTVSIQNIGSRVIPPSIFEQCMGLQVCTVTDSTFRAGDVVQVITTIYTVVDSSGQSASQIFRVRVFSPGVPTARPTGSLPTAMPTAPPPGSLPTATPTTRPIDSPPTVAPTVLPTSGPFPGDPDDDDDLDDDDLDDDDPNDLGD